MGPGYQERKGEALSLVEIIEELPKIPFRDAAPVVPFGQFRARNCELFAAKCDAAQKTSEQAWGSALRQSEENFDTHILPVSTLVGGSVTKF